MSRQLFEAAKTRFKASSSQNLYSTLSRATLPNGAGQITRVRNDPLPGETLEQNRERNKAFIQSCTQPDCYTVIATPTVIDGDRNLVHNIVRKVKNGELKADDPDAKLLSPGHISVHSQDGEGVSHRSRNSSLNRDIDDSMKDPLHDTYIGTFPKKNFPDADFSRSLGPYELGAKPIDGVQTDNCATAAQLKLTGERNELNPLQAFKQITKAAFLGSYDGAEPSELDNQKAMDINSELGINRNLHEVAADYRNEKQKIADIAPPADKEHKETSHHVVPVISAIGGTTAESHAHVSSANPSISKVPLSNPDSESNNKIGP
ncbi:MAG: hypothetical protein CK424_00250 [Legionella sp.]|nr:MAG: hypothetical protein CK424_00250 [Legionella sp.]